MSKVKWSDIKLNRTADHLVLMVEVKNGLRYIEVLNGVMLGENGYMSKKSLTYNYGPWEVVKVYEVTVGNGTSSAFKLEDVSQVLLWEVSDEHKIEVERLHSVITTAQLDLNKAKKHLEDFLVT